MQFASSNKKNNGEKSCWGSRGKKTLTAVLFLIVAQVNALVALSPEMFILQTAWMQLVICTFSLQTEHTRSIAFVKRDYYIPKSLVNRSISRIKWPHSRSRSTSFSSFSDASFSESIAGFLCLRMKFNRLPDVIEERCMIELMRSNNMKVLIDLPFPSIDHSGFLVYVIRLFYHLPVILLRSYFMSISGYLTV